MGTLQGEAQAFGGGWGEPEGGKLPPYSFLDP